MLGVAHVDEVNDDEPAEVAQAQLPGDFLGRLGIGLEGRFLDRLLPRRAPRIHVDGDKGLGLVDDDGTALLQVDLVAVDGLQLLLELVLGEQRLLLAVQLDAAVVARHYRLEEVARAVIDLAVIDQNFLNIGREVVADGADHEVLFAVDQGRGGGLLALVLDAGPQALQVRHVALQLGFVTVQPGGAHDDAHVRGRFELGDDLLELLALFLVLDLARNAAGGLRVGHEHQVTPRQRDVGAEAGALGAQLLLDHLHDDALVALQHVLDAGTALALFRCFAVVVEPPGVDLANGQEAVPVAAVIHERGLQARLDFDDDAVVDVAFDLFLAGRLDGELFQNPIFDDGDAAFFLVRDVNEHPFLHLDLL